MFQITHVEISGFWGKFRASTDLFPDVNVFIGKNGSGKTTFMDLLQAALRVDLQMLSAHEFSSIVVKLGESARTRTIRVVKDPKKTGELEFRIAQRRYKLPIVSQEISMGRLLRMRPRMAEEIGKIKAEISELVNVVGLSVHRSAYELVYDEEYERRNRGALSPIDQRLSDLSQRLTSYQLALAEKANRISTKFQKDVLASMLYDAGFDTFDLRQALSVELKKEKEELTNAYRELGALDAKVTARIDEHIRVLHKSLTNLRKSKSKDMFPVTDIMPLPLLRRTQHIINLSLDAENKKQAVFRPVSQFVRTVRSFMADKRLEITSTGDLVVERDGKLIPSSQLSSGEKQLLILLTETLLQNDRPFVFLADEPELSLHIEWQEKIIASIKELNRRSQIIVATHSPEIAGAWKHRVIDMEQVVNAA